MRINDERIDTLIEWWETVPGEIYEFSIPSYRDRPFIGMIIHDGSFNLGTTEDRTLILDLEKAYGITIYDTEQISYIQKIKTELTIKAQPLRKNNFRRSRRLRTTQNLSTPCKKTEMCYTNSVKRGKKDETYKLF